MKRKITLVVLLATGIVLGYLSFIAWAVGFVLARYFGNKTSGESGRLLQSRIIPLGKYRIHVHHWIWSSCAIIVFAVFKGAYILPADLFYGFFGAIVFHGIYYYNDWYKVLISRKVQSLVVAKGLEIEKVALTTRLLEIKQEIEAAQANPRICPPSSRYTISQIGDSASTQDKGLYKEAV